MGKKQKRIKNLAKPNNLSQVFKEAHWVRKPQRREEVAPSKGQTMVTFGREGTGWGVWAVAVFSFLTWSTDTRVYTLIRPYVYFM